MVLKVWYKFIKDFEDYSGNRYDATINSSTYVNFVSSGKTSDSCCLINQNGYVNIPLLNDSNRPYYKNVTISFWHKNYGTSNWIPFSDGTSTRFFMASTGTSNNFISWSAGEPNYWIDGVLGDTHYTDGKWHHYVATNVDLTSWSSLKLNGNNGTYHFGYINDLRIYSGELSRKEIYELSRGKILHYSMDKLIEPTVNLLDYNNWNNINNGIGSWNVSYGGSEISLLQVQLTPDYKIGSTIGYQLTILDDPYGSFARTSIAIPTTSGVSYTFSCYYLSSDRIGIIKCDDGSGNKIVTSNSISDGNWERLSCTYITNTSGFIRVSLEFLDGMADDICTFVAPMLEKKPNMTDFVWGSRSLYLVSDSSGFNNNTYININNPGIPSLSTTSKINDHSYYFTSPNDNTTNGSAITTSFFPPSDELTISFWAYKTVNGYLNGSYFSIGSLGYMGVDTYNNSCSIINKNGTTIATIPFSTTLNRWDFAVIVISNSKLSSYINGELYSEISYVKTTSFFGNFSIPFRIGYSIANNSQIYFNGYMNDFRIYATALSIEDIKNLYNKKYSIDRVGTLYSTKFLENNSNSTLPKNSVCTTNILNEVGPDELLYGLAGWWKLNSLIRDNQHYSDENFGICDSRDYSCNGLHANNVGSMNVPLNNFDTNTRYGGYFNASSTLLEVSNILALQITSTITLCAWIRPGSEGDEVFICKNGTNGYSLGIFYTELRFTSGDLVTQGGTITKNIWNHVAVTSKTNETKLYVNGQLVKTSINPYSPLSLYGVFRIGGLNVGNKMYQGLLNDVRVYNRALNQNEISLLANKGYDEELKIMNNKIFIKNEFNEINI